MLSASAIVDLQDCATGEWHRTGVPQPNSGTDWLAALLRQHQANFELWHIEDEARAPGVADAELAAVKRRVDKTNQRRNDLAEELDRFLLGWLEAHRSEVRR